MLCFFSPTTNGEEVADEDILRGDFEAPLLGVGVDFPLRDLLGDVCWWPEVGLWSTLRFLDLRNKVDPVG